MGIERNIQERLHTVESAAELLGFVSPSTIRSWITQGKLTRVKVGRLTRVRESELLGLVKVKKGDRLYGGNGQDAHKSIERDWQQTTRTNGEDMNVFALIDPRNKRVFHVGLSNDIDPELRALPEVVANRIQEIAPGAPQLIFLQTVESHPHLAWIKWCIRFRRDLLVNDWKQDAGVANVFTNSKRTRRVLGENILSDSEIQARFHAFERKNPKVFDGMLRRAQDLRDEGRDGFGVGLIICEMRADGFKIPNDYQPIYARKLQMIDDSLCGLFVMNPCGADDLVLKDGRTWRDFAREHADSISFGEPNRTEEDAQ